MIDADQHIFEPRSTWRDHIDPQWRDDALSIDDDGLGHAWLMWRGQQLYPAESQVPGRPRLVGADRLRRARGEPPETRYDDLVPPGYTEAGARVKLLDEWGIDATILLPNFGLGWEHMLASDLGALCANLRAYNRWMAGVVADGAGRLHGVGHLTLRDRAWALEELAAFERAGIRLAMVAPAPVDGLPLAHPDLVPVWSAFEDHDVALVFHVGGFKPPFDPAWYSLDPEPVDRLLDSTFLWVAPAVALHNLIVYGAFERHPRLRVGVIELTAHWVPEFLMMTEGALAFHAARHGGPPVDLPLTPTEYFHRHVRVGALPYEQPGRLIDQVGPDIYMAGSDWPHAEGVAHPRVDYESAVDNGPPLAAAARNKLLTGNVGWLLGE